MLEYRKSLKYRLLLSLWWRVVFYFSRSKRELQGEKNFTLFFWEDEYWLFFFFFQCIYGCYVHSAILPTFHRRCYWLLQVWPNFFSNFLCNQLEVQTVNLLTAKNTYFAYISFLIIHPCNFGQCISQLWKLLQSVSFNCVLWTSNHLPLHETF